MRFKQIGRYVLVLALALGLTGVYINRRNLVGRYLEHERRAVQLQNAQDKRKDLEKRIDASQDHVEHLGSDPVELEDAIRRTENRVREGEKVYRIEQAPK